MLLIACCVAHATLWLCHVWFMCKQAPKELLREPLQVGDMRPYLMGFFDTTSGPKREAKSYVNIAESLAVDSPEEILFATDLVEEAAAAKGAGWSCVLVRRPGNAPLPNQPGFPVIDTMDKLLPTC